MINQYRARVKSAQLKLHNHNLFSMFTFWCRDKIDKNYVTDLQNLFKSIFIKVLRHKKLVEPIQFQSNKIVLLVLSLRDQVRETVLISLVNQGEQTVGSLVGAAEVAKSVFTRLQL